MHKNSDKNKKLKVGISHGDINGIGYEIIIKSLSDQRMMDLFTPIVYGSSKVASYHRKINGFHDFSFNIIDKSASPHLKKANLIEITDKDVKVEIGKSSRIAGELAFTALEASVEGLKQNNIDVLVTSPINKSNIQSEQFDFPGHTEYLAKKFDVEDYLMLMVSGNLRLGVVTGHIPIQDVSKTLSIDLISRKIKILHESLIKDFGISKPKIALLGLNPHAGDDGLLGKEENEIIIPAIKKAFEEEILVFGPYPADGFFGANTYNEFDGVLAMYHDQGMIAFKTLSFDSGVNFTAGLPIVRTSPSHGTAYEIAGKRKASTSSFHEAIYLAIDIFNNRKMYAELTENPLVEAKIEISNNNESSAK